MMECFLVDKTITLHDLANNGLLQLDQIRSYNPSTVLLNQSTSNDQDDQRKENDEIFLDELDSASRRPVSKSSEVNSLSKRLNETSMSTKSPRPSKSFSDERQRKSSFSLDSQQENKLPSTSSLATKPRRRQVVATATSSTPTSSRPVTTSSRKKPANKCKNLICT